MSKLTDEEREAVRDEMLQELQEDHDKRLEDLSQRKQKAKERAAARAKRKKEAEEAALRETVREEFYRENGYQLYHDSSGRTEWVSAEEYEWRTKRRRHRQDHEDQTQYPKALKYVLIFVGTVSITTFLAFLLR